MVERVVDSENRSLGRDRLFAASRNLVPVIRAADAALGKDRPFSDFDLVDPIRDRTVEGFILDEPSKEEAQSIANSLKEHTGVIENISVSGDENLVRQRDFLIAKLRAQRVFIGSKYLEEEIEHADYIEIIMGIRPEEISEEVLENQKKGVVSIFEELGGDYTEDGVQNYRNEQNVSPEEFEQILKEKADMFLGMLKSFLGRDFESPVYEVELANEDEYWFNWAEGDRKLYVLKINQSERHTDKLTPGKAEAMALHEITGHFAQMINWQEAIDRGRLAPALGITSVVDPEQVTNEGIAETLHLYVPQINESLSPEARFELESEGLRQMAYNNVHVRIARGEIEKEEVFNYIKEFCPAETKLETERQYEERQKDPVKKAYLYAYGIGYLAHRRYAQILNRDERRSLLRLIYRQPLTPIQERDFVFSLAENSNSKIVDLTGNPSFLRAV
jgi:hypothetical protein